MNKSILAFMALYFIIGMNHLVAQQKARQSIITTDYLIYTPPGYDSETNKEWPLMINLHGTDQYVTIETLPGAFLPNLIESGQEFPMLIVNPLCNKGRWNIEILNSLLDDVIKDYSVDEDRIYLTGYSMGGYGTWDWVFKNPERFAAISPIAGCVDESDYKRAWRPRNIPTWIIHGEKDDVVDVNCVYEALEELEKYGANPKVSIHPDKGHNLIDIWGSTLTNEKWYDWMLGQNRKQNIPKPVSLETKTYEKYQGEYILQDRKEDTLQILYDRNQLYIKYEGEDPLPIHAESRTLFYLEEEPTIGVEFKIRDNEVEGFDVLEDRAWPTKRIK